MQFLVIARVAEGTPMEKVLPLVKDEAAKVWEYYAAGLVRSIYYIADMSGAVLLCEANSLEELTEAVNKFPMKQANALNFEILPLLPYTGIGELFARVTAHP